MRTTVTLDPDLEARLRSLARERGISFKEAINTGLRAGLDGAAGGSKKYRVPARPLGLRAGIDLDRATALADELEDSEIARKLELRK